MKTPKKLIKKSAAKKPEETALDQNKANDPANRFYDDDDDDDLDEPVDGLDNFDEFENFDEEEEDY